MPIVITTLLVAAGCGGSDDPSSSPGAAGDQVSLADFASYAEDVCASHGKLDFDRDADLGEMEAARRALTDEMIARLRDPEHLPTDPVERASAQRFIDAFADDADARADLLEPYRGEDVYARLAEARQRLRGAKDIAGALVEAGQEVGAERCIRGAQRGATQPIP